MAAQPPIAALDILWITAGLGCDGDTIAMTAATQPSLEDLLLGAIPWTPKVRLYNPFLAIENGDTGQSEVMRTITSASAYWAAW